jgi:hypothetical protein
VVTFSTFSVALFGPTQLERTITVTAELDPDDARRVVFSFGFPYFAVGPLTYDSTVFVGTIKTTAAGDGDGDGGLSPALAAAIAVPAVLGGLVVVSLAVALIVWQRKRVRPQPVRPRRGSAALYAEITLQHDNALFHSSSGAHDSKAESYKLNRSNWSNA